MKDSEQVLPVLERQEILSRYLSILSQQSPQSTTNCDAHNEEEENELLLSGLNQDTSLLEVA